MKLKQLLSREAMNKLSRLNRRSLLSSPALSRPFSAATAPISPPQPHALLQNPSAPKPRFSITRRFHSTREARLSSSSAAASVQSEALGGSGDTDSEDGAMSQFLSRFVWIMRGKLVAVYSDCDKETIDAMLLVIVERVVAEMERNGAEQVLGGGGVVDSEVEFSEDLWRTVWEVSNMVREDMEKERKKEKMKKFQQSEKVNELCRFAGEIGVRGDLLRELRFKFAREELEEVEFYEGLKRLKEEEEKAQEPSEEPEEQEAATEDLKDSKDETFGEEEGVEAEKPRVLTLPKRHGKIKYKIYGLDLSDQKWVEAAEKINEAGVVLWPEEPKPITGKCKLVTEKILSLKEEDDPSLLLEEWVELLQPTRTDWNSLLDRLKEANIPLYHKVLEQVLSEESFQPDVRDYWKLIDGHAKASRIEDAERIVQKMADDGVPPDVLTYTVLVHMYSKAGNLDRAKEVFERLRSYGFLPEMKIYRSMITAFVNAGQPRMGETLIREMETKNIEPSEDMYMAILRSYAQNGEVSGAARISTTMQFAGFEPTRESCTLLVEAYMKLGDPDQARSNFDYMLKLGHNPDDRCTSYMIAAYQRKNLLDKALNLLVELEKDGFQLGVATLTVLLDWMAELHLIDEAEDLLTKISHQGEAPPYKVHVSLCVMYAKAGLEKKALQTLAVLEAKKEQLGPQDFERVISGLMAGGFMQEAQRILETMEAQGFQASDSVKVSLRSYQMYGRK